MAADPRTERRKNARLNVRDFDRQDVRADQQRLVVDDVTWERFLHLLGRPTTHKPRLQALLREPSILDRR